MDRYSSPLGIERSITLQQVNYSHDRSPVQAQAISSPKPTENTSFTPATYSHAMRKAHLHPVTGSRYGGIVATWKHGRSTIEYLLDNGRLQRVASSGVGEAADRILSRAERRVMTARAGFEGGDHEGAFVAAYDAYRMAAEALLICQGLRATGGEGSHITVEDSASAQFSGEIEVFAKPTFERFRRLRHSAQYFDPDMPEVTEEDAEWAITTGRVAIDGARHLSERGSLPPFDL